MNFTMVPGQPSIHVNNTKLFQLATETGLVQNAQWVGLRSDRVHTSNELCS